MGNIAPFPKSSLRGSFTSNIISACCCFILLYLAGIQTRAFRCKYRGPSGRDSLSGMADDPLMPIPAGKSAPCNRACRFAYPGEEAVYCQKHKMSGMVDVVNPSCKVRILSGAGGVLNRCVVGIRRCGRSYSFRYSSFL